MVSNPHAARILCYGDSNTWGQNPDVKGGRFAVGERWTSVAQSVLGDDADIIEEGLSSRTTDLDYSGKPGRNGRTYFVPCLQSQNPLDVVAIMLGTNDLKVEFGPRPAAKIAKALAGYIDDVREYAKTATGKVPKIAIISPILINADAPYFAMYYTINYSERSVAIAGEFAAEFKKVAEQTGSYFFDASTVASPGVDGIHMDLQSHMALGKALAGKIKEWTA